MNLTDAITAVENASITYVAATTTANTDQANADAIQAKADAAKAQVDADKKSQGDAAVSLNASLDTLSATALASKIIV